MDLPPDDADPVVIQGETQIRGYRVIVTTGPLSQPRRWCARTGLPQEDVKLSSPPVSCFGRHELSLVAIGLGTATSLLTDALINAPAQSHEQAVWSTRFEIDPVIGGRLFHTGSAFDVGKRISKK
jgi:hypothetical protein